MIRVHRIRTPLHELELATRGEKLDLEQQE